MNNYKIIATEEDAGTRLDKFLSEKLEDISRSRVKTLVEGGNLLRNGKEFADCSYKIRDGDEFELNIPEPEPSDMMANKDIKLNIVYEDDDILVIDKQAGLTVHPGAGNHSDTMANALMAHCGDNLSGIGGVQRPGIVHRLDKDTSGLMLVAKNDKAHNSLAQQISDRVFSRTYTAICWGVPKPHKDTIEGNIGRHPKNRLKMAVLDDGGKHAVTHYAVKKIFGGGMASLVECKLETGRTHQIRVHLTEKGHPLIGDQLYFTKSNKYMRGISEELREFLKNFKRQALHSSHVGVEHPVSNDYISYSSELPEDMRELVRLLEG